MKIIAIGYGISPTGREIIKAIAKNILEQEVEVIDVKSMAAEVGPTDTVLLFGKKAAGFFSGAGQNQNQNTLAPLIQLPDLKKLEPGNDEERNQTYEMLLNLKQTLQSATILTTADLEGLTCEKIQALEANLKDTVWKGKTKSGKSIELSMKSKKKEADISITFSELYAIRMAMDVLGVDEVVIS